MTTRPPNYCPQSPIESFPFQRSIGCLCPEASCSAFYKHISCGLLSKHLTFPALHLRHARGRCIPHNFGYAGHTPDKMSKNFQCCRNANRLCTASAKRFPSSNSRHKITRFCLLPAPNSQIPSKIRIAVPTPPERGSFVSFLPSPQLIS